MWHIKSMRIRALGTALIRALVVFGMVTMASPGPESAANEITQPAEEVNEPAQPPSSLSITCSSSALITFDPPRAMPQRVVRIDVIAPAFSDDVVLLSELPMYFESELALLDGHRWSWFTWVPQAGEFDVTFMDSSRLECAVARLVIGIPSEEGSEALTPTESAGLGEPPTATSTRTPRIRVTESSTDEDSNDNVSRSVSATRTPTRTRTPTPTRTSSPTRASQAVDPPDPTRTPSPTRTLTPTPTEVPVPVITNASPSAVMCGQPLTLMGRGFGSNRGAVDGKVTVADRAVTAYELWTDTEIRVLVALNTPSSPEERVEVITRGGASGINLRISC
ncbi:MAG: IPT/TIG domain-containing protein [Chloroflexota bacterium]